MNRIALTLLGLTLALSPSAAAMKLSLYPSFTEVQQPLPAATRTLAFTAQQWTLLQPDSFTVGDGTSTTLSWQPTDPDWLQTQEGQRVTWIRAGQPPLPATFERAEDLLLKLDTGGYVNASRNDLAFGQKPPPQSGMVLRLGGTDQTKPSVLTYRTQALSWMPRYKLNLEATGAKLVALAQITNASDQVFTAEQVDLYGGTVQQGFSPVPTAGKTGQTSAPVAIPVPAVGNAAAVPINSVGEVRGLQRYVLPGGLTVGRGERLTLPFLTPQVSEVLRYASVQSYFDGQSRAGPARRHYKWTSSQSLPTGNVDLRESGLLVGSVRLPAVQAGTPVDLDLGDDAELRYAKTVKRTGQAKDAQGRVLSTTSQVTYRFVSTKTRAVRVTVREQVYGRSVVVDGQPSASGQMTLTRQVTVPAGGTVTLSFTLKLVT